MEINSVRQFILACLILFSYSTSGQTQEKPPNPRPRVGLALGGGGALGLAHVGVLRFLEEHRIPVDCIAGTSMGALVGGLYATGHTPAELEKIANDAPWADYLRSSPKFVDRPVEEKQDWNRITGEFTFRFGKRLSLPAGINPGQQLALLLSRETVGYSGLQNFDDLPIPFRAVATDLVSADTFVLQQGSLAKAMRASMALPAVFTPVNWKGHVLIDGGLVDNLPTDVVRDMGAEVVIAVVLQNEPADAKQLTTIGNILKQSVSVAVLQNERRNAKLANVVINVPARSLGLLDFDETEKAIESGYKAAQQNADALERFALSQDAWEEYLRDRNARRRPVPDTGNIVAVHSPQPSIQQNAAHEIAHKLSDGPVSEQQLEATLTGLTAATGLPGAFYTWHNDAKQPGFSVELEPRPDHELLFRPTAFYQISQGEPGRATLRLNTTTISKDAYKSRFLTDVFIGYDPGARFEYYHPFDGSSFFVAPGFMVQRLHSSLYEGSTRTDFARDRIGGSFYVGAGTWRFVQVRLGVQTGFDSYSKRLVVDGVMANNTPFINPEATLIFNDQDSGELPKQGTRINGSAGWSFRNHSYPYLTLNGDRFHPIGKKFSVFAMGEADSSFGRKLTFYDQFTLGGLGQLDAYRYQQFHANTAVAAGGGLVYRGLNSSDVSFRPYLAGWYEGARMDLGSQGWQTHQSTSVGVLMPTPLGLTGLMLGVDETGRVRLRFSLGTFWNRP
ncbi:MAG TPA: patatin-like phospholipase family protein [Terriglobales bacterium]|jgi:NTE family protein|nr:patatin-like phospholipase family protein [Terriglobales bacterium]